MSEQRWSNVDGMLHVIGDCPTCGSRRDVCRLCRQKSVHYQPIWGGFVEICENCDPNEWQSGEMPRHDECGIVED